MNGFKHFREASGLRLEDVACELRKRFGITLGFTNISHYERRVSEPKNATLFALAEIYGATPQQLVAEYPDPQEATHA
jgi:transcriptional regulator with XRE-family HTH domain